MVDAWLVETKSSEKFPFYTRANVGEVFPDPVAPLTFSFGFQDGAKLGASEQGFRDAYVKIGAFTHDEFPADECLFLGVKGGYAYLNASALRLLGHRAPDMTYKDIDDSFFGDAPGVPEFVVRDGYDNEACTAKIGETFGWILTTEGLDEVEAEEMMVNQLRIDRPDLESMTDEQLQVYIWHLLDDVFPALFAQHIYITFCATLPIGIITGVAAALGEPEATLRLIAGLGDVESAAPSMAMWDLGRAAATSPTLSDLFSAGLDGLNSRIRAADGDDVASFVASFDDFLMSYGARGPNEWEVRSPTWETDPNLALAAIDRMRVSDEKAAPKGHNAELAADREAIGARMLEALAADPETQGKFAMALSSAQLFMPGRERTKTNCVKLIQEVRMAWRTWEARHLAAGTIPNIGSLSLLVRSEQDEFLADPTGWYDVLVEREALLEEVKAIQEPFLFVGEPEPMSTWPQKGADPVATLQVGDTLQGIPGCPGKSQGIARVLLDSHDPTRLEPGDVLVAPITDPSWTPLFVPAAAVVVDVGAPLSHAIIVSRELGIPCVVSATNATKCLADGTRVEVDGDTGIITVIELP